MAKIIFTLRGIEKVSIEFALLAISHNLRKLAKKRAISLFSPLIIAIYLRIRLNYEQLEVLTLKKRRLIAA